MAYRVVVDKPQQIRALASSASISVADAQLTKSQVVVTHASYAAAVSSRIVGAFAAYSEPVVQIYYQNLSAIDIALDPYSLNKYFRLEQFSISDAQALLVTKGLNELVGAADQLQSLDVLKGQTDSFGMGDNAVVLLEILRAFTDAPSVIDTQALSFITEKADNLAVADTSSMFISKTESEVANIGEELVFGVSKPFADSASLSDQLSRAAVFQRSFSDAFALDDFTDVDAITKDSTAAKNNVIGFSDTQTFGTEKTLQDSAALSELAALSTERAALDVFSVGDVFQKVTAFSRAFTESTLLSDSSITAIGKELSDATTLSEAFQKNVVYNRTPTDSVVFAEQSVAAFSKELSDAALITESIQIRTASLASSLLNASALNGSPLNN
jgi:hypothetical protein